MALHTKKTMMRCFEEMLREMSFDKITVSALVKRSNISPNTFYYHYSDIYALLDAYLNEQIGFYASTDVTGEEWNRRAKEFLYTCREEPKIIYHLYDSMARDHLERYIYTMPAKSFRLQAERLCTGVPVPVEKINEIAEICQYAYIGFVLQFLWGKMTADIDAGINRIANLFRMLVAQARAQGLAGGGAGGLSVPRL